MGALVQFTYRSLLNGYSHPGETRLKIVRHVFDHTQPFDREEIVTELFHSASRSTVYRTLEMLVEFGMATCDHDGHYRI